MKKLLVLFSLVLCCLPLFAQRTLTDTATGIHDFKNDINVAVYSLDGRRLIAASNDRYVRFYDGFSFFERYSYSHFDQVTHVAISRDNSIIASCSKDRVLKIYFEDSSKMLEFTHEADISDIVFDYAMRTLYTASPDGNIRSYDLKKGVLTKRKFALGMPISSLTISHTGLIIAGLDNGEIRFLNYMGKQAKSIQAHNGEVTDLCYIFYKNKQYLASGSVDKLVKVWDVRTYKEVKTFSGHTWDVNKVELSRDNKFVMSAGKDGSSKVWNIETGVQELEIPSKGETTRCISMSGDNSQIATVSLVRNPKEYIIYIWNTGLEDKPEPKKGVTVNPSKKKKKTLDNKSKTKEKTPKVTEKKE
ncbi:MAG: hypothetical protein EP332_13530 [Bacteroidetes bacterium]|nr:MAG: hypothetical protein EP332_13530 [Bacteroidota bacterium]